MKIGIVHNWYRSSVSGENQYVKKSIRLLRNNSNQVIHICAKSSDIKLSRPLVLIQAAFALISLPLNRNSLLKRLKNERVEVLYVHNVQPLISPRIVSVAHQLDIPVVQMIHNYRLTCIKGTQFRNNSICHKCKENRLSIASLRYKCYQNSFLLSFVQECMRILNRVHYLKVDKFVTQNDLQSSKLIKYGISKSKIQRIENWITDEKRYSYQRLSSSKTFPLLFLGGINADKNIDLLLEALKHTDNSRINIRLAGSDISALKLEMKRILGNDDSRITYLGILGDEGIKRELSNSFALLLPSKNPEGYPNVFVEAAAQAVPAVISSVMPFTDSIPEDCAWKLRPDVASWANFFNGIKNWEDRNAKSKKLKDYYDKYLTEQVHYTRLKSLFENLL